MATYRRNSISRPDGYVQDSSASIRSTALSEIGMSLLRGPAQDQQQGEQQLKRKINRKTGYSGAYNSIIIAVTTISIPFLALTGALLYLVLHHRVEQNSAMSPDLQLPTDRLDSSAYYVDFQRYEANNHRLVDEQHRWALTWMHHDHTLLSSRQIVRATITKW